LPFSLWRGIAVWGQKSGKGYVIGMAVESDAIVRTDQVSSRSQLTDFIRVPWTVYAGDERWVPPLMLERRMHLSKRNPYFKHAKAAFWVAYRGRRPVGRISAQVNRLHLEQHQDATGHFGFLEAVDDPAVFGALFGAAEAWLRGCGMKRILGPFSLSINDECGLLIDGYDTPPMFLMGHGRPYYDARIFELGYKKAKDTVAYMLDARLPQPEIVQATVRRLSGRVRIRPASLATLKDDLETLRDIFNDAWLNNWCYIPFTAAEFADIGSSMRYFVPPEFIQIVEVDGEPAAMMVVVPNLNDIVGDLDGRLLPFGWLKLLWRLKRDKPKSARVPLMGIRRKFQRSSLGMLLVFLMIDAVWQPLLDYGVKEVELSWVLEDNLPMRHIKERLGARTYKTYRFYDKSLDG
jgi:hypothetical protein